MPYSIESYSKNVKMKFVITPLFQFSEPYTQTIIGAFEISSGIGPLVVSNNLGLRPFIISETYFLITYSELVIICTIIL